MSHTVKIINDFGKIRNWIGGKLQASTAESYQNIYTPYTGEIIGEYPQGNMTDVDTAVKTAQAAFKGWSEVNIRDRAQVMYKLKALLEKNLDELANLESLECGKTIAEGVASVQKGIELVEFAASLPNKIAAEYLEVSEGITCRITKEPLGVVASIAPFNFPVMVPLWTLPISLTVGNCVVLKPSEQTPVASLRLAELLQEAGLPDGVLNVVNGDVEVVQSICKHPGIKAVSFVGSTKVAKIVYAAATSTYKQVTALGGAKNYLTCLPDADISWAPQQIVNSAMGCAGQRCMATNVMIAVGDCQDIIDKMVDYAKTLRLGHNMGAIINKPSIERIEGYITQAEKMGAKVLVDGRGAKPSGYVNGEENGYWVGPTLIDNVTLDIPAGYEEIFGPVLSIMHVNSLAEAMEIENKTDYGNQGSIFTTTGASAEYVAKHATSGMIGVNIGVPVPREPFSFGGWNDSRFGATDITGEEGIVFWTRNKKVTTKWVTQKNPQWFS